MDHEHLDALKQRHEFDAWQSLNRLDRELVIRRIAVPKDLIAGLDATQAREIDPGDGTRLLRMSWSPPGQDEAVRLFIDIRECDSLETAHRVLLELIANMQAPDVKRLEHGALGDVAFGREPITAVIFARGNITISIWNGGETVVPVDDLATTIDEWIIKQPD